MKLLTLSCFCVDVFPEKAEYSVGGNALNVAISAKENGGSEVSVMGAIGQDSYGDKILAVAKERALDTTYLHRQVGQTAHNKIYISKEGDRYFKPDSWQGGVYQDFTLDEEDKKYLHEMDGVATTIHDSVVKDVVKERTRGHFLLSVDFHDDPYAEYWEALIPHIDLFFISGKESIFPRLKDWASQYNGIFVATLGEKGSIAFHKDKTYQIEAVKVDEVVDTTGCGDSYQGAFIASYLLDHDIEKAMRQGALAASKTLSHIGGV